MCKKCIKKYLFWAIVVIAAFLVIGIFATKAASEPPSYWRRDATSPNNILLQNPLWELGSSVSRIAKGWFNNLDVNHISIGGVSSGNLDMNNNLILHIGTSTTNFTPGGGLNLAGDLTTGPITVTGGTTNEGYIVLNGGSNNWISANSSSSGLTLGLEPLPGLPPLMQVSSDGTIYILAKSPSYVYISNTDYGVNLDTSALTIDQTIAFPNTSGTFALGTGTANHLAYWSNANTLTGLATGTPGYILTATGTSPYMLWAPPGANTTLSNLGTTQINASLIPATAIDLGSSSHFWANIYTNQVNLKDLGAYSPIIYSDAQNNLVLSAGGVTGYNIKTLSTKFVTQFPYSTLTIDSISSGGVRLSAGTYPIFFTSSLSPGTNLAYTIGNSSYYWDTIYSQNLYLNSTAYLSGATAGAIGITGKVGIGTTTPSYSLQVLNTASSTIAIGDATHTGCIVMGNSNGAGVTYLYALNGTLYATSTKPAFCQ